MSRDESVLAVEVADVSLTYRIVSNAPVGRSRRWLPRASSWRSVREVEALRGVSLRLASGTSLGVIGSNGAGKSSLLRVMAGIIPPTTGVVRVRGDIGTLLSVGVGFRQQLSGRDNVMLAGLGAGKTRREMQAAMDGIIDFAELRDVIDLPVRTYSSGMAARLAFSVATEMSPDILLIDEALSTGDAAFKAKARERIETLMDRVSTMVMVSHALDTVRSLCKEAVWLDHGVVLMHSEVDRVVDAYLEHLGLQHTPGVSDDF